MANDTCVVVSVCRSPHFPCITVPNLSGLKYSFDQKLYRAKYVLHHDQIESLKSILSETTNLVKMYQVAPEDSSKTISVMSAEVARNEHVRILEIKTEFSLQNTITAFGERFL